MLAGSGHIAGVVNPPDARSSTSTGPTTAVTDTFEEWIATAEETPGSWWPHWIEWLTKQSGPKIDAREPGASLGVIEDAPGSYVKTKG